ncbi:MAG TPA: deoxyribonuclease IV [Candidatus Limnocylindrales bacterium]
MLPDGRRLGAHLPIADGMVKAADRAAEIGATALQVFSDNPTAWQRRAEPSPEIAAFREALDAHDIAPLVVHASYLINLAGADDVLRDRSIELLASELEAAERFGARIVNVHAGSHGGSGAETGIARLVDGIARALAAASAGDHAAAAGRGRGPAPIVAVESSSGGGWGIGVSVAEWSAIARAADAVPAIRDRVAFCLDTAHLWGAGIDVSRPAAIDDLLAAFDGEVGLDRLALVHLNDTRAGLGSRMDRHEHLGAGEIGADGLGHLLRHPRLGDVPIILETPGMEEGYDAINLARARALANGDALEPLPPEAFALEPRRSRTRAFKAPAAAAGAVAAATVGRT